MLTLEVFFDYSCPFCLRGHEILLELMSQDPKLKVEWHPCEAHPRPESYSRHSDLCARGMFFVQEQGGDLMEYHRRMYKAAVADRVDIENPTVLAQLVEGLVDSKQFNEVLSGDLYLNELLNNNQLAWDSYRFPAVPSYRMDGKLLKAIGNVGTTKERLEEFLY